MRKLFLAAIALFPMPAMAAVTITALPTNVPFVEDHTDLFDVAQGTLDDGSTGGYPTFQTIDAYGAVSPTSLEPGHFVFNDFSYPNGTQYLSLKTPGPVTISGFNLYLGSDPTGLREFSAVELMGSLDRVNYTSLTSFMINGPTYLAAYGSTALQVQATFAPATFQYFRLQANDRRGFEGGRILEFDAISGTPPVTGAVPEPATWAMMLLGFAMVGGTVRARRRKSTLAYA